MWEQSVYVASLCDQNRLAVLFWNRLYYILWAWRYRLFYQ